MTVVSEFKIDLQKAGKVLETTLNDIQNEILLRDYWIGSPFEFLAQRGGPDDTGKWGEMFLYHMISCLTYFDIEWGGDNNKREDGTYDLWFFLDDRKIRIEVKTSRFGKTETWQHENIIRYGDPCDKLVFVDFEYSTAWITILDCKNVPPTTISEMYFGCKHPAFGTTPCLRDGKTSKSRKDKYKWDFSPKHIERGVASGLTYCHDVTEPDFKSFSEFLIDSLTR
jgi:hypothetical protein